MQGRLGAPEDEAVEENDSQDAHKDIHQPGVPLLAEVYKPVAVPDCLLLF